MKYPAQKGQNRNAFSNCQVGQVLSSLFRRANLDQPCFSLLPLHALLHNLASQAVPTLSAAELQLDLDK